MSEPPVFPRLWLLYASPFLMRWGSSAPERGLQLDPWNGWVDWGQGRETGIREGPLEQER